jgi:lipopolysaccharide biosynthesis glycosyltransferase
VRTCCRHEHRCRNTGTAALRHAHMSVALPQIIHYCSSPKPWEDGKRKGDLEMLWWTRFVAAQTPDLNLF